MPRSSHNPDADANPAGALANYLRALAACAIAIALKFAIHDSGSQEISPFLFGFAAVIASAMWAGPGPGVVCTILLTIWSAIDLQTHHVPLFHILIRCFGFAAEGLVLCYGAARMARTAREVAGSEAWHRQLVETASEGIWIRDSSGVITFANARMAEMLAVPVDALTGKNANEFFFPADLAVERIRLETLTTGSKEQFDRRLRRADGTELWVLTCRNPLPAKPEEMPSALGMMTDITERKRAETALRHSEERFRNLFESVPEGIYQSTPDGRIVAANPMLLKMFGVANEAELAGLNAKDFYVDPAVRKRLMEQLERDGSVQNVEYELRRRGTVASCLCW